MNKIVAYGPKPMEALEHVRGAVLVGAKRPDLIRDELLAEIFSATVRRSPDATAMICGAERLSYAEVERRALAIARGLVSRGVGPGGVVGLWLPRGTELLVAQIAITMTGAAWLPFDADTPVERIAVCLGDAEARGLLTSDAGAAKADGSGLTLWTSAGLASDDASIIVDARAAGAGPDTPVEPEV